MFSDGPDRITSYEAITMQQAIKKAMHRTARPFIRPLVGRQSSELAQLRQEQMALSRQLQILLSMKYFPIGDWQSILSALKTEPS